MTFSKNGIALIVLLLSMLGVNVTESEIITIVGVIGQVVSALLMIWNQADRPNIKGFIFKK